MKCALLLLLIGAGVLAAAPVPRSRPDSRLRLIIETDAGGDPDDEQSLVRFLLYTCDWNVEAIIANRAETRRPENSNPAGTGLEIVRRQLQAYGQCHSNLVQHDARYPAPAELWSRTVPGYDEVDDAVNRILQVVDRADPQPVWYADWGSDHGAARVNLRRALDRVRLERGEAGYARFKSRLRILCHDQFPEHTRQSPPFPLWVNTFEPAQGGLRWYHRFSALTARAGGMDLQRDVLTGHGPLGALYPTETTHRQKEGDSMTFLYLVPTGMNDPQEPTWGSWAGRYGLNDQYPGLPYYWANQADAWKGGTNRDNTLLRWAEALQNDFRARLDWCVRARAQANHPPQVRLNHVEGTEVLRFHAPSGSNVRLDATGTTDPDGDALDYEWSIYAEAGTCRSSVRVQGDHSTQAVVPLPAEAAGQTLHVLLTVTDHGSPPLTRYRRAVISIHNPAAAAQRLEPFFQPPAEFTAASSTLRSPLLFPDGHPVRTPAEWAERREQLRAGWFEIMGPWPTLLVAPKMEVLDSFPRDNFVQRRVRLEIGPGQSGEGWLLLPDSPGPHPAVLVVYYEPETSVGLNPEQPWRDFGLQLARRGFVTLSIGTPGGNAWNPGLGTAVCQPLSYHAFVAANCWQALARLPEVDARRIGVVGHSYGGKWALFAGACWEKFAAVAVSDPGIVFDETRPNVNYWEPWYLGLDPSQPKRKPGLPAGDNPVAGAYKRLREQGHDLHELHALIAPRPFLVSGGAEDPLSRWPALNHAVAVNRLLGLERRVAMTSRRDHTPNPESNEQIYAFFERFLK